MLEGSHRCGRLDHGISGDQSGADPERVEQVKKLCPPVFVELEPGMIAVSFLCSPEDIMQLGLV